jgi:hypothetical protein
MADNAVMKFNRNCGGGPDGWCQYVVADEQLEDFPAATLLCARVCRLLLGFFIIFCVLGLISGWLFEGDMTLMEEVITKNKMPLPNIAVCPQPWGSTFTGNLLTVESAQMVEVPGGKNVGDAKYTETTCPPSDGRLLYCSCVDLSENIVKPEGKRGELAYFDYIKLRLSAENDSPAFQFALGFYSGDIAPQQWSYVTEGHIVEGDVKMEEVATGKTEFSDGDSVSRFSFRVTGDAQSEDGMTTLVFGYDKYLSFVISSFASKWSFFCDDDAAHHLLRRHQQLPALRADLPGEVGDVGLGARPVLPAHVLLFRVLPPERGGRVGRRGGEEAFGGLR